nr:tripartite tricarboxylate transporter permease [Halomonas socia]
MIPLLVGIFAVSEILHQISSSWANKKIAKSYDTKSDIHASGYDPKKDKLTWKDFKSTLKATWIGTGVGTFIGALPGAGSSLAAFMSYSLSQRFSRQPDKYGKGSLEGVAAAESGNSATSGSTLIPLFAFGIPGSATAALIGAALIMLGVNPGPTMVEQNINILYAIFIILIYANFMNLGVCKFLLPVYSRISMIQPRFVIPVVLCLTILGTYASGNSINDVWLLFMAGFFGLFLRLWAMPLGPLVLGFIIGPGMERSLRQALLLNGEDWTRLLDSPIALGFYATASLTAFTFAAFALKKRKRMT